MGREIWANVTVVLARERERIGPHELYIEPGLIYVTD